MCADYHQAVGSPRHEAGQSRGLDDGLSRDLQIRLQKVFLDQWPNWNEQIDIRIPSDFDSSGKTFESVDHDLVPCQLSFGPLSQLLEVKLWHHAFDFVGRDSLRLSI